jgi:hypothetical protein
MLHRIRHINFFAVNTGFSEQPVEEFTCRTDEGLPLFDKR